MAPRRMRHNLGMNALSTDTPLVLMQVNKEAQAWNVTGNLSLFVFFRVYIRKDRFIAYVASE